MTDGATEATTQHDWTFIGQRLDRTFIGQRLDRMGKATFAWLDDADEVRCITSRWHRPPRWAVSIAST